MLHRNRRMLFIGPVLFALAWSGCSKDDNGTQPPPNNTISDGIRPIVFVHGALEAADAFVPLTQLFVANGYTWDQLHPVDFVNVQGASGTDVSAMTSQLASTVASVLASTGADRVDIVAHGIGAQAVQRFLVQNEGTSRAAHVAFLAGAFDPSVKRNGSLVPGPCKYLALRSNGTDATQGGNSSQGILEGAENSVIPDVDHQQILAASSSFSAVYSFFTGQQPSSVSLPAPVNLKEYTIRFRVVSMFDNTPVAGATVSLFPLKKDLAERQSGGPPPAKTDADGYVTFTHQVNPFFDLEIAVSATGYHDMHIYRQPWRADSRFERLKVLPKTGGSAYLQSIVQALPFGTGHATVLVCTPYRAWYDGRDRAVIEAYNKQEPPDFYSYKMVELVNPRTAPLPTSTTAGKNTFLMFVSDFTMDKADGGGPVNSTLLESFGISSYDVFLNTSDVSLNYGIVTMNTKHLAFRNFRSQGTTPNNGGISIVQFDYTQ